MDRMLNDLALALRGLRRSPLYSAAAIITLALGIGATTSIYSVVDATMLKPLPYAAPERLMDLSLTISDAHGPSRPMVWSYPKFETMREMQHSFAQVAGYAPVDASLTIQGEAERERVELVSGTYFPLLRTGATLGRLLQPSDDQRESAAVVVLSHALWMRRFAGDSQVVGRSLTLAGRAFQVVGVAAPEFRALSGHVDMWTPMARARELLWGDALVERWSHWMDVVGRLNDGVTSTAAAREFTALGPRIDEAHRDQGGPSAKWGAAARTMRDARNDPQLQRAIVILFGAVCCVLLIACVNVANLLLARAAGREREFAVRVAIGAARGRLVRQLLTETMLLSLVGGTLGVVLSLWSLDALRQLDPGAIGSATTQGAQFLDLSSVTLNGGVLAFALAISLATGLVCGLVPALRASRPDLTSSLKDGAGATSEGGLSFRRGRARALLIAGDVAISLLLLVGAGLLSRSFAEARGVDAGFDPHNVLTFRVQAPDDPSFSGDSVAQYKEQLLSQLAAIPGVDGVGVNNCTPLSNACNITVVFGVDGVSGFAKGEQPEIGIHSVNPNYLHVVGARLLKGRFISDLDRRGSAKVVVINNAAARLLFPGQDPVGHRISLGVGMFANNQFGEIVGVVNDINYTAVGDAPSPAAYVSFLQTANPNGIWMLRTRGDPSALVPSVRETIRRFNASLPVYDVRSLDERVGAALGRLRFGAVLLGAFAVLGLLLTIVGIYGVMSYSVAQRTRELGIRIALGAKRGALVTLVMQRAMALASLGVIVGLAAAWGTSRFLRGLVFGISPTDPLTFFGIAAVVAIVCAVASYLPARRAARLDPVRALHTD